MPSSHCRHMAVDGWVPVPKARPGSSLHDDRVRVGHRFMPRADPQPLAEAHGVKVAQPFALPGPVGDRARLAVAAASIPSAAASATINAGSARCASYSACSRVCRHSRISPGRGSSTGSSLGIARRSRTVRRFACRRPRRACGSRSSSSKLSSRCSAHARVTSVPGAAPGNECRGRRCGTPHAPGFPGAGRCWS